MFPFIALPTALSNPPFAIKLPPVIFSVKAVAVPFKTPVVTALSILFLSLFNVSIAEPPAFCTALAYIPEPGAIILDAIDGIISPIELLTPAAVFVVLFSIWDTVLLCIVVLSSRSSAISNNLSFVLLKKSLDPVNIFVIAFVLPLKILFKYQLVFFSSLFSELAPRIKAAFAVLAIPDFIPSGMPFKIAPIALALLSFFKSAFIFFAFSCAFTSERVAFCVSPILEVDFIGSLFIGAIAFNLLVKVCCLLFCVTVLYGILIFAVFSSVLLFLASMVSLYAAFLCSSSSSHFFFSFSDKSEILTILMLVLYSFHIKYNDFCLFNCCISIMS